MTQFRFHRGSLEDSLKTRVEVSSKADVLKIVREALEPYEEIDDISIRPYGFDDRINEEVFIVVTMLGGISTGAVGFTNGELK